MADSRAALRGAFAEDHRRLTAGLSEVLDALRTGDATAAVRRADALDREAGAHIQFEEEVYYPELEPILGREFVSRLYAEHEVARRGLCALRDRVGGERLDEGERARLISGFEAAIEHAESCGTLLSHLDRLGPERWDALLARLLALRSRRPRWTGRAPRPEPSR